MENKVSDEKLQLFAGMETVDAVDKTVKSMASELLSLRTDAETSQKELERVNGELDKSNNALFALQEATRWIPVGEGVIPMDILLEIGNTKTGIVDVAVYGSISWQVREPTHYRLPVPPEGG